MVKASGTLERRVLHHLADLPLAEIGRNHWGVLSFKWPAPAAALEALWLCVSPKEVTLSCRIAHIHFSGTRYLPERLTHRKLKMRIARDAVSEAARFMRGEIAVAVEQREDGSIGSSMWCPAVQLPAATEGSSGVLGRRRYSAWTWFGEMAN